MKTLETQVVVIGGGATGTAVLRDLAMRGIQAILLERGNLASGTSGNFHGLLHSGARYAVKDPPAAEECIVENRILRQIAPQAIEDTGGFFVALTDADEAFLPRLVEGCQRVGIPVEIVSGSEALREDRLSPHKFVRPWWCRMEVWTAGRSVSEASKRRRSMAPRRCSIHWSRRFSGRGTAWSACGQ